MTDFTLPIGQSMVMMRLGGFSFGISTAAYQELTRRTEYLWPGQQRFGKEKSLQFVGKGADTMTLSGVIYPGFRGGFQQVNQMRGMAGNGKPLSLIDGNGRLIGKWVITSVDEKQSTFAAFGAPRRMEFSLSLEFFPEKPLLERIASPAAGAASSVAPAAASADTSFLSQVKSKASSLVQTISSQAKSAIDTVNGAIQVVQQTANEVAQTVGPVIGAAQQAVSAVTEVYQVANQARDTLRNVNSLAGVSSVMTSVMSAAGAASRAGSAASVLAEGVGVDLSLSPGTSTVGKAVTQCAAGCGQLAVSATSAYTKANDIVKSIRNVTS